MLIHKHEGVSYIMMYSSVDFFTTIYILFIDVFLSLEYFGVPMRDFYKWNCFPGIFLIKLLMIVHWNQLSEGFNIRCKGLWRSLYGYNHLICRRDTFTPFIIISFYLFSCLVPVASISSTTVKKRADTAQTSSTSEFRGNASHSSHSV